MGEVCPSPRGPQVCQLPKLPRSCLHNHCNATPPAIPPVLWEPLNMASLVCSFFFPVFSTEEDQFSHRDRKLWGVQTQHTRRWPCKRKAHRSAARPLHPGTTRRAGSPLASTVPVPSLIQKRWCDWPRTAAMPTLNRSEVSYKASTSATEPPDHSVLIPEHLALYKSPRTCNPKPQITEWQPRVWTSIMPFHNSTEHELLFSQT